MWVKRKVHHVKVGQRIKFTKDNVLISSEILSKIKTNDGFDLELFAEPGLFSMSSFREVEVWQ